MTTHFGDVPLELERRPDPNPPSAADPRVRLYTLGRMEVVVDGQPLACHGKARRQPLHLLHGLLARGGRAVPVSLLRQTLGEGEDFADRPLSRGAFDMALSRLRRLLRVPDLLRLGNEQLSLNEDLAWVDAWAFERLLMQADALPDLAQGRALVERALRLYEGDFLPGEDSPWSVLGRERLRARLLRVSRRCADALEQAGRLAEAAELYETLRERFPLDEELCLRLIRSHLRRQQPAQAQGLRLRCRELLARVLGVLPGPAIEALFEPVRV